MASGEPNFYAYVSDSNSWVDVFGLVGEPIIFHSTGGGVIHPGTITPDNPHGIYTVDATGYNGGDRAALIEKSKIKNPGGNYHAHHIDYDPKTNTMRMQMVHKDYHGTHSHIGGGNDFKQDTGFKYGSDDAIAEANKRNKAKLKGYH
ncbi:hypothetical protein A5M85_03820 [Cellulophaga lytica]|nr:hypothetical protein A5M85_03820 [Cellulophaga lytica]